MPPLVLVIWEDAKTMGVTSWVENTPLEYDPHLVHQVGFLVLDVPEGIHITQAWHPDLIATPDQIPRGMIREVRYLNADSR